MNTSNGFKMITLDGGTGNGASGGNSGKSMQELLEEGMKKRGYTYSEGTFIKSENAGKSMQELLEEGMRKRGYTAANGTFTRTPYVSYADYGKGLLDRVNETDKKARQLDNILKLAPAAITRQDQTLRSVDAQADSVFKSGTWKTNPLVSDMLAKLYERRSFTAEKLDTMRKAYTSLTADAQKAAEENRAAVDAYNGFYGFTGENDTADAFRVGSGTAWDTWRGSIRPAETIAPELEEAQKKVKALTEQTSREREEIEAHAQEAAYMNGGVEPDAFTARRQALQEKERELETARRREELLQEEMNYSSYLKWEELRGNQDFKARSGYVSTANGKEKKIDYITSGTGNGVVYDETGFDDLQYDYINGNPEAGEITRAKQSGAAELTMGDGDYLSQMTDKERDMYNYVYTTMGREKAQEYLDDLKTTLTARQRTEDKKTWREYAAKDRVGASVFSAVTAPLKGVSYIGQAADYIANGKIDENARYNRFSYAGSAIRDQVSKTIEEKWGKAGSFLYQTGMSMADFLLTTAVSGGQEALALGIMGTGAAADSVIEAKDRGLSDGQAFKLGSIAGLAEIATERVSLEKLLDKTSLGKNALGYFLKNVVAEGSEEAASDVINWAADVLVAKDKSQWKQAIKAYTDQGMDENEAFQAALKDKGMEILLDAAGGALSGGVVAGVGVAGNTALDYAAGRNLERRAGRAGAAQMAIDAGLERGQGSDSYARAVKYRAELLSGKEASAGKTGRLTRTTLYETAQEQAKQEAEQERAAKDKAARESAQAEVKKQMAQWQVGQEAAEAPGTGGDVREVQTPAGTAENAQDGTGNVREDQTEEPTLAERRIMLERRETALKSKTQQYVEAAARGEDTGNTANELSREADAIEEERRALEAEEREQDTRAQREALTARERELTVAPTAKELEERRAKAGSLRELERSGRESGATEEQIATARRIADATGRKIVFMNEKSADRGSYKSGTIYVNAAYGDETGQIIAHEMTHSIEESGFYGEFSRLVQNRIMESGRDLDAMLREINEKYERAGVTLDSQKGDDMKEVVAEFVERELLTNEASITSLVRENRSLGRRILDLLDKLLAKLKWFKGAKERSFVQSARDLYAAALVDTRAQVDTDAALDEARQALAAGEITEEEFDRIFDALGVEAVEEDSGAKHSFAGVRAENADIAALTRAKQMEQDGVSAETVRRETGWFRGMDGKWRFEINDSGMKYNRAGDNAFRRGNPHYQELVERFSNGENLTEAELGELWRLDDLRADIMSLKKSEGLKLDDYVIHDELFKSYPQLRNVTLIFRKLGNGRLGNYDYATNTITLEENLKGAPEDTLIHEIQHVIQSTEGFTPGANIDYWRQRGAENAEKAYRNTAGEIEARDAANRRRMNAQERHATAPDLGGENTVFAEGAEAGWSKADDSETSTIKEQIEANRDRLNSMDIVGSAIVPTDFKHKDDAVNWAIRLLNKTGFKVDRQGYGTIIFSKNYIDLGMRYADTPAEKAAIVLLPKVLKRGIEIGKHDAHKARSKKTITFGAPVELNGIRGNMAVVINRHGDTYYAHRIVLPDGSIFTFPNKNDTAQELSQGVTVSGSLAKTTSAASNDNVSQRRGNVKTQFSIADGTQSETEGQEKQETDIRDTIPAKARDFLNRVERGLVNTAGDLMQVPKMARREYLREIAADISREYLKNGTVSDETVNRLFETAYDKGVEVDREFYDQYKDLKKRLRETRVTISLRDRADVRGYDKFNDFRKAAMGILTIVNENGTPVDVAYQELAAEYPGLFPKDITSPGDMISQMYEVGDSIRIAEKSLDEALGSDAKEFRKLARHEFEAAVENTLAELRLAKRYADERAENASANTTPLTLEEVKELYPKARDARKNYEKVNAKQLLTEEDQRQVGRLMRGEIELSDLTPERDNVRGITAVFEAKQEYEKYARQIREWNNARKGSLRQEADEYLKTANGWKDKPKGILYSRETMERNVRDIVPDQKLADRIVDEYFKPVHEAAAKATKLKNQMRDRVRALNISRKVVKGNTVSEAHAVQLMGEALDNIDYLTHAKTVRQRDGKSLADWRGVLQELYEKNPNMDWEKVKGAVEAFRKIYNELFELMNDSRVRNGYEPVAYRRGYFPHFQPGEGDGIISLFGKALGISTEVTALPTTINGLTHTFRPGIQWFGNALERTGFNTAYDAVEGFDKYIEGVADVIYQTENIQKLRALASQTRYRTSDEGLRKQVDEIRADTTLLEQDKENRIKALYENGRYTLSNFVVELEEYTNLLANKKSRADRNMEQALGRNTYNLVKALESRVAANMVAVNPGSWLTNFIPLTQGWAMLDSRTLLRGMWDTLKAYKDDDGIVDMSAFLTNRHGSDPLVRTWQQEASAKLSSPMEWIDNFTAGSLVRARYRQNINRGMSETAAMEEADSWVAGVMADRSKGSTPTLFNRSAPLTKMFTQFQLEVNNQLGYVFKDIPRGLREKGTAVLAAALFKFALGAWLYNELYEYFIGRRPALDPIGIINDTVGDLTGYELPNMVSLAGGSLTGNIPSFETNKGGAVSGLINNVADQLPFMGVVGALGLNDALGLDIDAGRLPVTSAIPDLSNLGKAVTGSSGWAAKKRVQAAIKEVEKPLLYVLLPFGGGQLKKILQGVDAAIKGGSFTVDEKGRNIMQYPVYKDTLGEKISAYAGGVIFGKASNSNAVKWVNNNFKNYTAKATGAYQGLVHAGVRGRDADELIIALAGAEKTEEKSETQVKIETLKGSSLPDSLKIIPYYAMIAGDKKVEVIDKLAESAKPEYLFNMLMDYEDAGFIKGDGKTAAQIKAVCESKLSDKEKIAAMEILEGNNTYYAFKMQTANSYGISMKDYYAGVYGATDSNGDGSIKKDEVVASIRKLDLTKDQKAVLYQLANTGYKPETNPFSTRTGKTVYDTIQKEKDRRENGEEGDEQKEKSGPRWENGRLVLPKFGESGVLPRR